MEQWGYDLIKILFGALFSVLAYVWTSTLHRIQSDIKDIKIALEKYDKRLDDLEEFRVQITTLHNLNHPNARINGIASAKSK